MNNYQEILTNILDHIYDSGLYDKIDKLKLSVVGDFREFIEWYNQLSSPLFHIIQLMFLKLKSLNNILVLIHLNFSL